MRQGISTLIIPKRNEKDVSEIPKEYQKKIHFVFVENASDVFHYAIYGLNEITEVGKNIIPYPQKQKTDNQKEKETDLLKNNHSSGRKNAAI